MLFCSVKRATRKKIKKIYMYPNGVYSITMKDPEAETIWCNDKVELYAAIRSLGPQGKEGDKAVDKQGETGITTA